MFDGKQITFQRKPITYLEYKNTGRTLFLFICAIMFFMLVAGHNVEVAEGVLFALSALMGLTALVTKPIRLVHILGWLFLILAFLANKASDGNGYNGVDISIAVLFGSLWLRRCIGVPIASPEVAPEPTTEPDPQEPTPPEDE
ncbi:MAG: hypothetical protein VB862_13475 [Pirellulaceae bacterium]